MSQFKGTKGSWYVIEDKNNFLVTCDNPYWDICNTISDLKQDKANVLLISKAPEMLEMLEILNKSALFSVHFPKNKEKIKQLIKQATEI